MFEYKKSKRADYYALLSDRTLWFEREKLLKEIEDVNGNNSGKEENNDKNNDCDDDVKEENVS